MTDGTGIPASDGAADEARSTPELIELLRAHGAGLDAATRLHLTDLVAGRESQDPVDIVSVRAWLVWLADNHDPARRVEAVRAISGYPRSGPVREVAGRIACMLASDAEPRVRRALIEGLLADLLCELHDPEWPEILTWVSMEEVVTVVEWLCLLGPPDPSTCCALLSAVSAVAEPLAARGRLEPALLGVAEGLIEGPIEGEGEGQDEQVLNLTYLALTICEVAGHLQPETAARLARSIEHHPDPRVRAIWTPVLDGYPEARAVLVAADGQRRFDAGPDGVVFTGALAGDTYDLDDIEHGMDLRDWPLRGADLAGRSLKQCDLTGADLTGADLRGAVLFGAVLYRARLAGAQLDRANLSNAICSGADFRGASLFGASVECASLIDADFRGANLTASRFRSANLEGADLRSAGLDGWDCHGARLAGASFDGIGPTSCE